MHATCQLERYIHVKDQAGRHVVIVAVSSMMLLNAARFESGAVLLSCCVTAADVMRQVVGLHAFLHVVDQVRYQCHQLSSVGCNLNDAVCENSLLVSFVLNPPVAALHVAQVAFYLYRRALLAQPGLLETYMWSACGVCMFDMRSLSGGACFMTGVGTPSLPGW